MDKATRIDLFSMRSAPMRAFHLTWMAFFVCFFAWFACAPLMPLIKREYGLTADQVANINIAAVAVLLAAVVVRRPERGVGFEAVRGGATLYIVITGVVLPVDGGLMAGNRLMAEELTLESL